MSPAVRRANRSRLDNPLSVVLGQMEGDVSVTLPAAVDDLARQFMRRALPPLLSDCESLLRG